MDHDDITNKRVRRIAKDHGCTVDQANAALDRHPIELDRERFLRRTRAMELLELDELAGAFREKAIDDRDVAAGALLVKIAERRATLLGMNAPIGHAVAVIQHPPAEHKTSTQKIRGLLDNILKITYRERELLTKAEDDGAMTAEARAEIDRLRAERGEPPLPGPYDPRDPSFHY